VWDKKPAAIISASIGAIGGFGANHQLRQSCVFLNMPMMQQPEAYLSNISDDDFNADGTFKDGRTKDFVEAIAHAFHDWVDMIHRSRALLADDAAHQKQAEKV
jgi:chromate reductase